MRSPPFQRLGFTVLELLVVVAVVGVLASLLFPVLGRAKAKAKLAKCSSNLKQVSLAIRMYADDSNDAAPQEVEANDPTVSLIGYKRMLKTYLGSEGASHSYGRVFACPSDTFYYDELTGSPRLVRQGLCEQAVSDYSSYAFNGGNASPNSNFPGISGRKLSSVLDPTKTVLVAEASAYIPWSWHQPRLPLGHQNAIFNDALNNFSFVDGHVGYIRVFWNDRRAGFSLSYDPPTGYGYKWSGD